MKKYGVILADPPWLYRDRKNNDPKLGGFQYPPMPLEELCSLNVIKVAKPDCALFMWVTMPMLREGLDLISAWGFRYITCAFVWVKLNPSWGAMLPDDSIKLNDIYSGLGHWVNGNAELCLFAKRGTPKRKNKNVKQIVMAGRKRHSEKPIVQYSRIENLIEDTDRIELFARRNINGWDRYGSDDGDIREWLACK